MAVPGEKCKRCQFCGKELAGDLEVFCPVPRKDPGSNVCWCVCSECKAKLVKKMSIASK